MEIITATSETPEHATRITQADALRDRFLNSYSAPNTRAAYSRDLANWYAYCDEHNIDPMAATRLHIEDWARQVENTPIKHNRGDTLRDRLPRPPTVHRMVNTVRALYKYAQQHRIITENPVPNSKMLHLGRLPTTSPTQSLTQSEAVRFLDAARNRGPRDAAMVAVMLYQGVRVGGLCDLDVEDMSTRQEGRTLRVRLKGGDIQEQLLADSSAELIDQWLATRSSTTAGDAVARRNASTERGRTPLFTDQHGRRVRYWHVEHVIRACAKASGVGKKLSPHSLRHTCITDALSIGVPLADVQTMAGHRNAATTGGYDRARNALARSPIHKLNGRFG